MKIKFCIILIKVQKVINSTYLTYNIARPARGSGYHACNGRGCNLEGRGFIRNFSCKNESIVIYCSKKLGQITSLSSKYLIVRVIIFQFLCFVYHLLTSKTLRRKDLIILFLYLINIINTISQHFLSKNFLC